MFTSTTVPSPFVRTEPTALQAAVEMDPDVIAVASANAQVSYADLDRWSNRLARVLMSMGAGRGADVVMALPSSVESVVTLWAAAKIGAALGAVDADSAAEVIAAGHVRVGVTIRSHRDELPDTIDWLVLDDSSTLVQYMTVSDNELELAA